MLFPGAFQDHPERKDVLIFYYRRKEYSDHFCDLLGRHGVYFEAYDPLPDDNRYCIAVYRRDRVVAIKSYEDTLASLKKPFIQDKGLRLFVVIFFLLVLGLAILGSVLGNKVS